MSELITSKKISPREKTNGCFFEELPTKQKIVFSKILIDETA